MVKDALLMCKRCPLSTHKGNPFKHPCNLLVFKKIQKPFFSTLTDFTKRLFHKTVNNLSSLFSLCSTVSFWSFFFPDPHISGNKGYNLRPTTSYHIMPIRTWNKGLKQQERKCSLHQGVL